MSETVVLGAFAPVVLPDPSELIRIEGLQPQVPEVDNLGLVQPPSIDNDTRLARIKHSFDRPFRSAIELKGLYEGERVCIVGSAPSLEHSMPALLELIAGGAEVMAVNKTQDWLTAKGIPPTFGVLSDPRDWVATYQAPTEGVKNLVCSVCCDGVFERFKDHAETYVWHPICDEGDYELLRAHGERANKGVFGVVGGSTTTLRAFDICTLLLGFREVHWFAVDSSAEGERMHALEKPYVDPLSVTLQLNDPLTGKPLPTVYRSTLNMFHQFRQFEILMNERREDIVAGRYPRVRMAVHGTGLLPDWCALRGLHADPNRAAELRAKPETKEIQDATA